MRTRTKSQHYSRHNIGTSTCTYCTTEGPRPSIVRCPERFKGKLETHAPRPHGVLVAMPGAPHWGVTVSDLVVKRALACAVAVPVASFGVGDAESPIRLCMIVSISSVDGVGSSSTISAPVTAVCSNSSSSSSCLTAARSLFMTCSNTSRYHAPRSTTPFSRQ